jgi:hypothetical protein
MTLLIEDYNPLCHEFLSGFHPSDQESEVKAKLHVLHQSPISHSKKTHVEQYDNNFQSLFENKELYGYCNIPQCFKFNRYVNRLPNDNIVYQKDFHQAEPPTHIFVVKSLFIRIPIILKQSSDHLNQNILSSGVHCNSANHINV